MKRKDFFQLYNTLFQIKQPEGVKFTYAIAKNLAEMKKEIEVMQKAIEPSAEFNAYETERIELAKQYANKDVDGQPIIIGQEFDISNREAFDKAFTVLQKKNENILEDYKKKVADYNLFIEEDFEHSFFKLKLEDIPESMAQYIPSIFPIIE